MPTLAQSLPLTYSLNEEILTYECGYCLFCNVHSRRWGLFICFVHYWVSAA